MSVEKVIDLDAIRSKLDKGVWKPGVSLEQAVAEAADGPSREDVAGLLALLDEARGLLLHVPGRQHPRWVIWNDERRAFLARFPAPSPTGEETT